MVNSTVLFFVYGISTLNNNNNMETELPIPPLNFKLIINCNTVTEQLKKSIYNACSGV